VTSDASSILPADTTLIVRRFIRASPERLFSAWTDPEQLLRWWGPRHVTCVSAEVDLRVGGRYRIANRFPDGSIHYISGQFETVSPPHRLVYTWQLESNPRSPETVTVRFEARDGGTDVIVVHDHIASVALRDGHAAGWDGCLDGLVREVEQS
jgi:uncharacterized protein YndB with AHSA1/START domain